jgi:DNA-binding HxlR family transcriptional regulator
MRSMGRRWTVLILSELYRGRKKWKRYSEIKKEMPEMTSKILSMRLKDLEKEGLLKHRVSVKRFPIKSEYCLTKRGEDFFSVIESIKKWGLKWKIGNPDCPKLDCKECEF